MAKRSIQAMILRLVQGVDITAVTVTLLAKKLISIHRQNSCQSNPCPNILLIKLLLLFTPECCQ